MHFATREKRSPSFFIYKYKVEKMCFFKKKRQGKCNEFTKKTAGKIACGAFHNLLPKMCIKSCRKDPPADGIFRQFCS